MKKLLLLTIMLTVSLFAATPTCIWDCESEEQAIQLFEHDKRLVPYEFAIKRFGVENINSYAKVKELIGNLKEDGIYVLRNVARKDIRIKKYVPEFMNDPELDKSELLLGMMYSKNLFTVDEINAFVREHTVSSILSRNIQEVGPNKKRMLKRVIEHYINLAGIIPNDELKDGLNKINLRLYPNINDDTIKDICVKIELALQALNRQ